MPRAIKYRRGPSFKTIEGRVISVPGVQGIAWYVWRLVSNPQKTGPSVQLVTLPVGHVVEDHWSSTYNRLEKGTLVVARAGVIYEDWQEAALAIYGKLAHPYIDADRVVIECLVASIEGAGQSAIETC